MQIPGGKLVDQRGARNLATLALAVIVLGNLLALLVGSFAIGLVGRLIAGIGTGVGFVAGSDYIRATVGSASAQGLYGAAGVGGGGLAIAVVPLTTPLLDWRAPYVTALICASAVLVCLPLAPRDRRRGEPLRRSARATIADIVTDRRLYPLAIAHSASFGLSVIAGNWAVSLLSARWLWSAPGRCGRCLDTPRRPRDATAWWPRGPALAWARCLVARGEHGRRRRRHCASAPGHPAAGASRWGVVAWSGCRDSIRSGLRRSTSDSP
jgi:hypothetical protein